MNRQASILLLRGTNAAIANNKDMILENGQPLYDTTLGLLYVGNGITPINNLVPVSVDFSKNFMEDIDIVQSWGAEYQPPAEPVIVPLPQQTPINSTIDAFYFQTTAANTLQIAGCIDYNIPFRLCAIGQMKDTDGTILEEYSIICKLGNGSWDENTVSDDINLSIQLTGVDRAIHGPLNLYLINPDATETLVATGYEDFYTITLPKYSELTKALQNGYLYFRITASSAVNYILFQPQRFVPELQQLVLM